MTKTCSQKEIDPRTFSIEGQYANHYTMEPSVIATILKYTLVYAS